MYTLELGNKTINRPQKWNKMYLWAYQKRKLLLLYITRSWKNKKENFFLFFPMYFYFNSFHSMSIYIQESIFYVWQIIEQEKKKRCGEKKPYICICIVFNYQIGQWLIFTLYEWTYYNISLIKKRTKRTLIDTLYNINIKQLYSRNTSFFLLC